MARKPALSAGPAGNVRGTGADGKRQHTVAQIAAEFGVTRPTIYRHLAKVMATTPSAPT
jgi:DNA-binding phage protein